MTRLKFVSPAWRQYVAALILPLLAGGSAAVYASSPDGLRESDLAALEWREIGSAAPSGRIARFAVHPEDTRIIYAASASGGLWKTVNAGITWESIFNGQPTISMGDVALTPSNPDIVWLGTGEQNNVRGKHPEIAKRLAAQLSALRKGKGLRGE